MKELAKNIIDCLLHHTKVGIAMHEMLHRLGQRHEQARNDRNRYVKIVWKNIQSGKESNFYRTFTYDRNPYDVGSVMQYGFTVKKKN